MTCTQPPPPGYAPCTREFGHDGPCAMPFANTIRILHGTLVLANGVMLDLPAGELVVTTKTMESLLEYQKTLGK